MENTIESPAVESFDYRDTESLKAYYDENGFCIADGVYTEEQLAAMEAFFEDFKNADALFDGMEIYMKKEAEQSPDGKPLFTDGPRMSSKFSDELKAERQVRALHPHRYSQQAQDWFLEPRTAHVLEALLGKPALGAQTMYYYKPPGSKGQGMHQDNFYLLATPAACIGAWTPIDSADIENGCLYIPRGSHRYDIFCPEEGQADRWLSYGDSHISKFPRDRKPEPVPVKRGQTLYFHGHTIHGSGPNRSANRSRRTFIGHYVDEATESIARFYHPILNMQGEVVSNIENYAGGGPCGGGWTGAVH